VRVCGVRSPARACLPFLLFHAASAAPAPTAGAPAGALARVVALCAPCDEAVPAGWVPYAPVEVCLRKSQ